MKLDKHLTTEQEACEVLVEVMVSHGVRHAVVSPGSRNAPLIVAVQRCEKLEKHVVVDERSAGFVALGIAQQTNEPVGLICTSGTAVLNYAPAVAEAYYQKLPLIVISADRPLEWIDQNDSQTIRQNGVLSTLVKQSYDLPARYETDTAKWYINRIVNDAMIAANTLPRRPVHINIQLEEPLCGLKKYAIDTRIVENVKIEERLPETVAEQLAKKIAARAKVLVLVTFENGKTENLEKELNRMAEKENVVVLTETIANVKGKRLIPTIDRVLTAISNEERADYAPELLITMGGSPITRMLKKYMRAYPAAEQWHVGKEGRLIDTMQHVTVNVDIDEADFLAQINERELKPISSDYSKKWHEKETLATELHRSYIAGVEWCDLKAFAIMLDNIPEKWNLQLSNGTCIRYAQLFNTPNIAKSNCNRGVAGIDGATSTALGASLVNKECTLLITGDMSLSYDLNGLATQYNSKKFKVIVMSNGGGGIFRFIKGPSDLDELEDYFEVHRELPIAKYADTFGFSYFEAHDEESLGKELPKFFDEPHASILEIKTPRKVNAEILKGYFKQTKNNKN